MTTYADATKYDVQRADLGQPYRVCIVADDGSTFHDTWCSTIDEAIAQADSYTAQLKPEFAYRVAIFKCILTS